MHDWLTLVQDVARADRLAPSNWAMKDTRRWARRVDRPLLSSPEAMPLPLRVVKSMSPNSHCRRSINQHRTDPNNFFDVKFRLATRKNLERFCEYENLNVRLYRFVSV